MLALLASEYVLAAACDATVRNGKEAETLAAAQAEACDFDAAVATEEKAADVAEQQGKAALAAKLRGRVAQRHAKMPLRMQ